MSKLIFKAGTTSKDINIFVSDSSVSTGAGLVGLLYNSASLTAYYHRQGAATATAITLAAKTVGSWVTGGFVAVDGTNMPGVYELGIPDAALAAGATWVVVMLKGATNMAPVVLEIELALTDNQDAVRGGLSALPNAAAAATGGLPTVDASNAVKLQSGTAANQISLSSGLVTLAAGTHTGAVIPTVTTTTTATNLTNAPTAGDLTATMKASVTAAVPTAAAIATAVWNVLTSALTTTNSIGKLIVDNLNATISSVFSRIGAPAGASIAADIAAISIGSIPTVAQIDTQLSGTHGAGSWATATGFATPTDVSSSTSSVNGSIGALNNLSAAQVWAAGTRTLTAGGDSAATIWAYGTRTLTSPTPGSTQPPVIVGGSLSIVQAVSFDVTITGMVIPSTWVKVFFTVKTSTGIADSASTIQILVSNPGAGGDGLLYLNGAASGALAQGTMTIDQAGGNATISITDDKTSLITTGAYIYDLKVITSASKSIVLSSGSVNISATPTVTV